MKLFSRTNPRSTRGRTTQPSRKKRSAASSRRNNAGPVTASSATPLTLSLPPSIKRKASASNDSCSCSSTASLSSRTASTATASTVGSRKDGLTAIATTSASGLALDVSNGHRKKEKVQSDSERNQQCTTGIESTATIICGTAVKSNPSSNNNNVPSPLSPSDSHSSDESYHQPYIASAYYPEGTISHLENEVAKLSAALKRHRKYTPEWFGLDTKLSAAKEELIAVKEDRDLDFLDGDVSIPATVLVRSEEKVEELPPPKIGIVERPNPECHDDTARVSSTRQEYERAVQKLTTLDKFSDEWFLLQEEMIELRTKLRLEEEGDGTTAETSDSPSGDSVLSKNVENLSLPTLKDNELEQDETHLPSYLLAPATLSRSLSDSRANAESKGDFFPGSYHERSSSLPSTSSLFLPGRRSMSPPLLLRCSPPSSPLVSRNLFPSSASINSSYYSYVDDDEDDMQERSDLFSTLPHQESQWTKLRSEYAEACNKLDTLPKFSQEWFEQKTKTVSLEERIDAIENASMGGDRSVGGLSCLSFGVADRSNAAWSEEDDEIMSFASDLELVMIGEALKQGNCISPIANYDYEYFRDDYLLPYESDFGVFDSHQDKENVCATLIQAQWRRYQNFKAFRCMVSSAIKVQSFIRCKLQVSKYKQQRRKLIALQSSLRRYLAVSKYRHAIFSVARIQSVWRQKRLMRSEMSKTLHGMTSMQSPVQRWLARASNVSKRASVILIQNAWRGRSQRVKFLNTWKATICIQSYFRMKKQQRNYRLISSNVILVQSVIRGWFARRQFCHENISDTHCNHGQSSSHLTTIRQNHQIDLDKSMQEMPSIQYIRKKKQELFVLRSQVPKFSDEWFYATEQLQRLNDELQFIEREQLHNLIEELQSIEDTFDSRQDTDCSDSNVAKSKFTSSTREHASPSGYVMRIVQSIEQSIDAQTSSRQSSPGISLFGSGYINVSPNNLSSVSSNSSIKSSEEEDNLKRLGRECLRLTLEMENLPKYSQEWFQCKVELKTVTEELEFLYFHSVLSEG
ncbi:hypothetical protein HJC23_004045 [Cyclotella cryptica]|uniref:Uncharacterized protein n=1 Tax=Cyclotella cryptica TaxID=29204 RepID=A0ABD3QTX4_9STRA